jgi:hypothetical protein
VTQDGKEHLPRPIDALGVTAKGLGERLVDRLVEAGEILQVRQFRSGDALAPESYDAGAKGAIFGDHREQIEPRTHPVDQV